MSFSLVTSYVGESLLSGFDWFDGTDLSHGFVSYQNREGADALDLYSVDPHTNVVTLGVDSNNTYRLDEGRPSIRLESKESYNHGLFIADFLHMPPSTCGLWPAFWTYGKPWPQGGEIDIIEGGNTATINSISAHTGDGCSQDSSAHQLAGGLLRNEACAVGNDNVGCGFYPPRSDTSSYGDGFNAAGGGVYAMLWDSDHIRVWHFGRNEVPGDINSKEPEPDNWGMPQAVFGGSSCDVDSHFSNMNLVININFCGDYASAIWGHSDSCNRFANTCSEFVAANPEAFTDAFWAIKYIDVYDLQERKRPAEGDESGQGRDGRKGEPTTTKTMTATSTTTLTVDAHRSNSAGGSSEVSPSSDRITDTSLISSSKIFGCQDSSSGFSTFDFVDERPTMTLGHCVKVCSQDHPDKGYVYAGIYEKQCYCAATADSEAHVTEVGSCNTESSDQPEQIDGGRKPQQTDVQTPQQADNQEAHPSDGHESHANNDHESQTDHDHESHPGDDHESHANNDHGSQTDHDHESHPGDGHESHANNDHGSQTDHDHESHPGDGHESHANNDHGSQTDHDHETQPEHDHDSHADDDKDAHSKDDHKSQSEDDHEAHGSDNHEPSQNDHDPHSEQDDKFDANGAHESPSVQNTSASSSDNVPPRDFFPTLCEEFDDLPPPPPAMGNGLELVNTEVVVHYETIFPEYPDKIETAEYIATLAIPDCDCEKEPEKCKVPMATQVVECSACGPEGNNQVTLTVPAALAQSPAVTSAAPWTGPIPGRVTAVPRPAPDTSGSESTGNNNDPKLVDVSNQPDYTGPVVLTAGSERAASFSALVGLVALCVFVL
ncbi:hypothetical protein S7711_00370 [Stachybotrys chartarum IBT 7711]|uniref:GH16 domain-containing protein n=1 Tax=Stachybotrys chartarum (strain CBS 109288 / IBT 7711) TaxID=1280523 RepID=A0A084B9I5_STACB|nr:hypothetical protein S7711_00370 [Stachybotrys chartarum IBT 7711]